MAEDPNTPTPLPGSDLLPLPGSEKKIIPGAHSTGPTHPEELVPVTLRLRAKDGLKASKQDIDEVKAWAKTAGLTVVSDPTHEAAERNVKITGTVAQMQAAFGTELANYQAPPNEDHPAGFNYRGRVGPVMMPRHLVTDDDGTPIIELVAGLDDRPIARPHFRHKKQLASGLVAGHGIVAHASSQSFLPRRLAQLYNYPLDATGKGKVICIISLGGIVYPSDLQAAAQAVGVPVANVTVVPIDNARPTASDADGENALDVQEVATVAPGAKVYVVCAPNTDAGFLDAFTYSINVLKATQCSCSWGGAESNWTPASMKAFDGVFLAGQQLGCKVFCSAGDDGSSDGTNGNAVDFPGSSPNVVCCGGTRTIVSGSRLIETVWGGIAGDGATGGGFSSFFRRPAWQPASFGSMASRPDLAGNADPETGDVVWVNGQSGAIGGTSADSPRYAALSALIDEKLGRDSGPWNPVLWAHPEVAVDIVEGTNGAYNAKPGPDQTTGIGRVDGQKLLAVFAGGTVPPIIPPVVPPVATISPAQVKAICDGLMTFLAAQSASTAVRRFVQQEKLFADSEMPAIYAYLQSIAAV